MENKKIFLIIFFILFLQFIASFRFSLLNDDSEALHVGWLIKNGMIPYIDFFEHHHPLAYYLIAGLLSIKESIFLPKVFFFLIYLLNLFILWKIVTILNLEKKQKLIYIFLVSSTQPFVWSHFFLRPDVLMAFFCFLALYFYFLSTKFNHLSFLTGVFLFFSFLSLQTAIFFIFSIFVLFLIDIVLRRDNIKKFFYFGLGFFSPLIVFYLIIFFKNFWHNYFFFNFTFNKYWSGNTSLQNLILESFFPLIMRNPLIWLLIFLSLIYHSFDFFINRKFFIENKVKFRKIFFIIFFQMFSFFYLIFFERITIAPYRLVIFLPLVLIFAVLFLERLEKIYPKISLIFIGGIFMIIFVNSLKWIFYVGENNKIRNYILNNTNTTEKVLIFDPEYHPIFRYDADFCWFQQEICIKNFYSLNNTLDGILKIIIKEKPKTILFPKERADYYLENIFIKNIIEKDYRKTEFKGLYFRVD